MKFRVTMKTPDLFELERAITDAVAVLPTPDAKSNEDVYCQQQDTFMATQKLCRKWFMGDTILDVEVDTEARTCTVVQVEGERV